MEPKQEQNPGLTPIKIEFEGLKLETPVKIPSHQIEPLPKVEAKIIEFIEEMSNYYCAVY